MERDKSNSKSNMKFSQLFDDSKIKAQLSIEQQLNNVLSPPLPLLSFKAFDNKIEDFLCNTVSGEKIKSIPNDLEFEEMRGDYYDNNGDNSLSDPIVTRRL